MKDQVVNYQLPKLPEKGKAILYIVRPSPFDEDHPYNLFLNSQEPHAEMGCTMPKQYIYFDLTPGEHKIFSKAENWAEINVVAKEGDILFIQQEPTMGLTRTKNKLLTLQDYEGKYYVKNLSRGTFSSNNQQSLQMVSTSSTNAPVAQGADIFIGTIKDGRFAKGVGFSNPNVKLLVASESGEEVIFYVRSDSKVFDAGGNPLHYLEPFRSKGKNVEIEYFIITDATGGEPGRSDFAYEIGHKGVRVMRYLE